MIRIQSYDKVDLTLIGGNPGVGKSTISKLLCAKTLASIFDKDENYPLTEVALQASGKPPEDRSSPEYLAIRPEEYKAMMNNVFANLALGHSCVANAPFRPEFLSPEWRFVLEERCKAIQGHQISINYVWLDMGGEALRRSLIERDNPRDKEKLKNWDSWWPAEKAKPKPQHCFVLDVSKRLPAGHYADRIIKKFKLPIVSHYMDVPLAREPALQKHVA